MIQPNTSMRASENSLNDAFCEDFSQSSRGATSNSQMEVENTSHLLDSNLLNSVNEKSLQLLSPETQVPRSDRPTHHRTQSFPQANSQTLPISMGFPNLGNTCYMYNFSLKFYFIHILGILFYSV